MRLAPALTLPLPLTLALALITVLPATASADEAQNQRFGKIKGTGAVSSISGAGGGGLTPWATLSAYAEDGQLGGTVFASQARVDDYHLDVYGGAFNFHDKVEVSYARQDFLIKAADLHIRQDKLGLRYKVAGDIIYDQLPQITVGVEHGELRDEAVALSVGAKDTSGTDYTLSIARAWLNGIAHRTTLLNVNLRYGQSNQFGILGYGGDDEDSRVNVEVAGALFINRSVAVGFEWRQKPDNLSALTEHSARDLFVAYFPNKRLSFTAAWIDLGDIAGAPDQRGAYFSLQANL
tara:strand:- start:143 stop:1021 length:879 start_codon:yes stop_codon:yes gene_type:complete